MNGSSSTVGRWATAALVAIGVTVLVAGCFPSAPPPTGSESALAALDARLETIVGVARVTGEVRQVDEKDHPNDWLADVEITAGTSDLAIAQRVRDASSKGVAGTTLTETLHVPPTAGHSSVDVDPLDAHGVTLASHLRTLDFVASASVSTYGTTVALVDDVTFTEAVDGVRPLIGGGTVTLTRGRWSLGVTAANPGPPLLERIDHLSTAGHVSYLSYSPGTTYATSAPGGAAQSPSLFLMAANVEGIAEILAQTPDPVADARTGPRTGFWVQTAAGSDPARGSLGLPLGSARPDDTMPPVKTPAPTPPPSGSGIPAETWIPADVDAQRAALRAFLDSAVAATGVRATVTTGVEQCSTAGGSDLAGTRATARALVPVFTRDDDAQEPFDAVTASWTAASFHQTDQAMGLQFWAPTRTRGPVASSTIRGTVEGLDLTAESACVG